MNSKSELSISHIEQFEQLLDRLEALSQSNRILNTQELVTRKELAKRLKCTERSIINNEKKKKIKPLRLGTIIRYNWADVIKLMSKNQL